MYAGLVFFQDSTKRIDCVAMRAGIPEKLQHFDLPGGQQQWAAPARFACNSTPSCQSVGAASVCADGRRRRRGHGRSDRREQRVVSAAVAGRILDRFRAVLIRSTGHRGFCVDRRSVLNARPSARRRPAAGSRRLQAVRSTRHAHPPPVVCRTRPGREPRRLRPAAPPSGAARMISEAPEHTRRDCACRRAIAVWLWSA